jgi:hypothetical protein
LWEKDYIDNNYLPLLVASNKLPHNFLLGRIYVDEKLLEEGERERAGGYVNA